MCGLMYNHAKSWDHNFNLFCECYMYLQKKLAWESCSRQSKSADVTPVSRSIATGYAQIAE